VPLPHPSGASRWHQDEANRALIRKANNLIKDHKQRIFLQTKTPAIMNQD